MKQDNRQIEKFFDHNQFNLFLEELKSFLSGLEEVRLRKLNLRKAHLSPGPVKNDFYPADVTYKAIIYNEQGNPAAFLLCANPVGKALVDENIKKATQAKKLLGSGLNNVIDLPFCHGRFNEISWAMFNLNLPLAEDKIGWMMQRTMLAPVVLAWLTQVLEKSWRRLTEKQFVPLIIEPMERLIHDRDFSTELRRQAGDALRRMESGQWLPCLSISHNDLWKGNIMLPSTNISGEYDSLQMDDLYRGKRLSIFFSPRFKIIDWAGSSADGIPFFDLIKFCQSFKIPLFYSRKIVIKHCTILGCDSKDAVFYLIAAIALLGQHLDQFPRHAYLRLAHGLYQWMKKCV